MFGFSSLSMLTLLAGFFTFAAAPVKTPPKSGDVRAGAKAAQKCPALTRGALPLKYKGGPTVPAITACDLMTRLYVYADDSMMGRRVGTEDNLRATAYIEREVRRLGLKPAGDSGGYFQYLPVIERKLDSSSTVTVGDHAYRIGAGVNATAQHAAHVGPASVIFAGTVNDTTDVLPADSVRGKILVMRLPTGGLGFGRRLRRPFSPQREAYEAMLAASAGILQIANEAGPSRPGFRGFGTRGGPSPIFEDPAEARAPSPPSLGIQRVVAEDMFGKPVDQLVKGVSGKSVVIDLKMLERPLPTRNVVAILPGSDRKLRSEYVAIGAHNDHNGYTIGSSIEHDSLKAFNSIARQEGVERAADSVTEDMWKKINSLKDSLRKAHGGPRLDSIQNGADDDGSGSVAVLEIAEAFAKGKIKPKRSIIFVWHTGEESGLWGSEWFTNHPTVPRDSIVAQLNIDMVGRGETSALTGHKKEGAVLHGSPNYLQLVGSRRLSTELGDIVEAVNKTERAPLDLDYSIDANGHPNRIYCRSDHYSYARYGIPITFFTTGGHSEYHQNTDEPQYIQYSHMARVTQLIFDVAMKVADLDHRVVVDKEKPASPFAGCVQ